MKIFMTDLERVLSFCRENGFRKTLRKIIWALETRGIKVRGRKKVSLPQALNNRGDTNWTKEDLEYRASNMRAHPPRSDIRNFAYYLPQFHEIQENNKWWGQGFTEWTNVKKSTPLFDDHYQPHVPLNDDYYDLSDPSVMQRQADLARLFGIDAFVMYYYWFDGQKLLDKPFNHLLNDSELDFPYMICWANESWTRRWDGKSSEVLIEQKYEGTFAENFIADVSKHFYSPNYQTIDGRPVLLVYRPEDIPNLIRVTSEWRKHVKALGFDDIYLIAVQSFALINANEFGFDASANFAPNNMGLKLLKNENFAGKSYEYEELIGFDQSKKYSYPVFSCVTPSWDNTARRGSKGTVLLGSTPSKFRDWLMQETQNTIRNSEKNEEKIVFINAWNEWAEGSHLEPDKKYGYQWLHAVADCKEEAYWSDFAPEKLSKKLNEDQEHVFQDLEIQRQKSNKLILVIHDLHRNGAQINGLNMLKEFVGKGVDVQVIAISSGPLFEDFKGLSMNKVIIVSELSRQELVAEIQNLKASRYNCAIINSVASGHIADVLTHHDIDVISLVHEFPETIKEYRLEEAATKVARNSKIVVFPSKYVQEEFSRIGNVKNKAIIRPQGLYNLESQRVWPEWQATKLIQELNWEELGPIVTGIGYGDLRKGFDLFCKAAEEASHLNFLWLGDVNTSQPEILEALSRPPKNLRTVKFQNEISKYLQITDLLLITSRKDPFPSTVLEALGRGLPVVTITGCTGLEDLMKTFDFPIVSSWEPLTIFQAIDETFLKETKEKKVFRSEFIREHMNFRRYCLELLSMHSIIPKTVTAIVPSFNYERYLLSRLNQIENQTYTVDQIVFLDDASSDASFVKGCDFLHLSKSKVVIEKNSRNSGSAFYNWPKLIRLADSDYTWIAETDDIASVQFLNSLVSQEDDFAGLTYCNSAQVDSEGRKLSSDFSQYLERIKRRNFKKSYYTDGEREIIDCLSIQNTIPNVSAVLFRSDLLKRKLESSIIFSQSLKTAADWYLYIQILEEASVYYSCLTLNAQRRHKKSVIGSSTRDLMVSEILQVQEYVGSRYKLPKDVIDAGKDFIDSVKTD
jgi:glycosyltransferase involved in cell wall biosynthesis